MSTQDSDDGSNLDELATKLKAASYRRSLLSFVRDAWPLLEPDHDFAENWHIVELCIQLQDVADGKIKRMIINVPPGTMKSLLVSVIFPCWLWARNPKLRVLTAAYSDKRALDANIKARNLIKSVWFQTYFHLALVEDQNTKGRFDTTAGGWRIATSVGGEGTGLHPDFIVIDDAATATNAMSEQERKIVNEWFDQTMSSRGVSRGVAVLVIGQRLHKEDLPGHLMARGGWTTIVWPMRYEVARAATEDQPGYTPDPLDPRTKQGELLWPKLFDEKKVKQLELDLGAYGTAGQLQQQPSPEGGGLFKREWFKFLSLSDLKDDPIVRSARGWDTAATEGGGDWTRGVHIGETRSGKFVVMTPVGGQLGPAGVDALMVATATMDGRTVVQREEKEGGSSGKTVIEARVKSLKGFDYRGVTVSGSKVVRAKPFRSQVEGGNVYLLRGVWNAEYVQELCDFPTGSHDDYVDGSTCAFNAVLLEPKHEVRVHEAQWG